MERAIAKTGERSRALCALASRNEIRCRGLIDDAAEAKTAEKLESSISEMFRVAEVTVSPTRKGARPGSL